MSLKRLCTTLLIMIVAVMTVTSAFAQGPSLASVEPVPFGEVFPPHTFNNLNHGTVGPERIDTASVIGKTPVVFCYWIPRFKRSEDILLEMQALCDELGADRIALFAVATERPGMTAEDIKSRAAKLELHIPILSDEGYRIGQQTKVQTVPNIIILDREGKLRLANGASLVQQLEYKIDLAEAIRRLAKTGSIGTYGYLPKYYPSYELIGKKCPDFDAPSLDDGLYRRWSNLIDPRKLNVLVFWKIDCPHCKHQLPKIDRWVKEHPDGINIYSAARVTNEAMETKTKEFIKLNGIVIPTLKDVDRNAASKFLVTSTPTIFIIRPDGVIDSVLSSGAVDFGQKIETKIKELVPAS